MRGKFSRVSGLLCAATAAYGVLLLGVSVSAETFTSPSYQINGTIGNSAAGLQGSANYQLVNSAGESVIGDGAGGSYKLGQGAMAKLEQSLQLSLQPAGLVGYWPLDNSAPGNTAYDQSDTGNNGTYSSGSGTTTGKVGQAWVETTGQETVSIPHSSTLPSGSAMTVSGWIYSNNIGASLPKAIISKADFSSTFSGSWYFEMKQGANAELQVVVRKDASDWSATNKVESTNASLHLDTWYHVAFVYDGSLSNDDRVKIYLNGTALATTTSGTIRSSLLASSAPLTIGDWPGLNHPWRGAIDDVKLYDRPLEANEIKADYEATSLGVPAAVEVGAITPGVSRQRLVDILAKTDSVGYNLAIGQNQDLTSGSNTIGAASGTITSPLTWSEGSTSGLGFTLYGTTGTALPSSWDSGNKYAAFPNLSTTFYSRTGKQSARDTIKMRLRIDTPVNQPSGNYTNTITTTGTTAL